jgi:hypothetical protein
MSKYISNIENIIDSPLTLIRMSKFDLDNLLLDDKYNKQNLRELVKRCLKDLKEWKEHAEYLNELREENE